MCFLLLTAFAITRAHDLLATVMLLSIYSLLCASFFVVMDAVDVAFTEAAVGAVVSTLLLLSTLSLTGRFEKPQREKPLFGLIIVLTTGALLIYGTLQMPPFGSAAAPIHQHVGSYYINQSYAETGIVNLVTSVLASYRGYDTFGELVVIFTAGVGVLALLSSQKSYPIAPIDKTILPAPMKQHHILRVVSKMLIPLILLFALYVQFHGHTGPGGGFQAGVIFASAIVLYTMIFGLQAALDVISVAWLKLFSAFGVLIYSSVGLLSLLSGENFLDYSVLAQAPIEAQHLGTLAVEMGIGITVASTIMLIFFSFSGQMHSIGEAQ